MNYKDKKPFERETLGDKPKYDAFTIWLNATERRELELCKAILQQPKDSTAFKEMAHIGFIYLLGGNPLKWTLGQFSRNLNNNRKTGAFVEQPKPDESNGESPENLTE